MKGIVDGESRIGSFNPNTESFSEGYYSLGYWGDAQRTAAMSLGGWLTIGDLGRRDADLW